MGGIGEGAVVAGWAEARAAAAIEIIMIKLLKKDEKSRLLQASGGGSAAAGCILINFVTGGAAINSLVTDGSVILTIAAGRAEAKPAQHSWA